MNFLKTAFAATALVAMAPLAPAVAAAQPAGVTAGMEVVDTNGGMVGTVIAADDQLVTVRTDRHEVPVPANSFTPHEGKLLFGMTAAELNAAVDANMAAAEASVAVGKAVKDVNGVEFATIDEMGADYIQLALEGDKVIRIPVDGLQKDANGAIALYNAADLMAGAVDRPEEVQAEAEADPHAGHDMGAEGTN
ncbi:preprotein translocase subunit YajC [Sphingomicrobium arenosum]|uniref:hypothetical protein n=1 Tax=Sphingomicrobium arenosum TaxID=2233861 RepID=UPI00223FF4C7|nr:hypothetical protein [Sphingomicrobium arenosum]